MKRAQARCRWLTAAEGIVMGSLNIFFQIRVASAEGYQRLPRSVTPCRAERAQTTPHADRLDRFGPL
jgi:hypothetical protein